MLEIFNNGKKQIFVTLYNPCGKGWYDRCGKGWCDNCGKG